MDSCYHIHYIVTRTLRLASILLLLDLSAGAKEAVTCSGEDEGGWKVVNGDNRTVQDLSPNSENQCTSQAGTQENNLQTSSCSETANGTINSNKEQASQQVEK